MSGESVLKGFRQPFKASFGVAKVCEQVNGGQRLLQSHSCRNLIEKSLASFTGLNRNPTAFGIRLFDGWWNVASALAWLSP